MQYMVLIYDDEKTRANMPEGQRKKFHDEYMEFTQGIINSGHFKAGAQLQSVATATTIREKAGKRVSSDGPFAETKEQLGGYYVIEAKDLDEAIAIAGRVPSVRVGGAIEVRPIIEM